MPPYTRKGLPPAKSPYRANRIGGASFSIGAETSNVITVGVQLKDEKGRDLAVRGFVNWFLSDDANGDSIVATGVTSFAAGTDGWVAPVIAGKAGIAGSEADGDIDIAFTLSSGAKTCYLAIVLPDGGLAMSGAITFAA